MPQICQFLECEQEAKYFSITKDTNTGEVLAERYFCDFHKGASKMDLVNDSLWKEEEPLGE
jgi:hypothetical protein